MTHTQTCEWEEETDTRVCSTTDRYPRAIIAQIHRLSHGRHHVFKSKGDR